MMIRTIFSMLLFLYFWGVKFIKSTPYKFENIKTSFDNYIINICIEDQDSCFPFKISTSSNEFMIINDSLLKKGVDLSQNKNIQFTYYYGKGFNEGYVSGQHIITNLYVNKSILLLSKFKVAFVVNATNISTTNFDGVIGVGYDYSEEGKKKNIVSYLFSQKLIDNQIVTFGKKKFIIGDDIDLQQNKKYKSCKIKYRKNNPWNLISCAIESVIYLGKNNFKIFEQGTEIRFNVEHHEIYVPDYFYKFLIQNVFIQYIEDNICSNNFGEKHQFITCNTDRLTEIENDVIYIFIQNWNIKLEIKKLFKDNVFQLFNSRWNEIWLIGHILMDNNLVTIDASRDLLFWNP